MYNVGLEISQNLFYCWPLVVRLLLWMLTRDECSADMFHINCNIASRLLSRVTWNLDNTKRNENWYIWYSIVEYIIMHLCMPIFIYIKWRHCLWCCQFCKYIKIWTWDIVLILQYHISSNKTCISNMNYSFIFKIYDLKLSRYWFNWDLGPLCSWSKF